MPNRDPRQRPKRLHKPPPGRRQQGTRATWTGSTPTGYHGVLKELGTDAWLRICDHHHETRGEAIACAREL